MSDVACIYPECVRPYNLLPYQYQGWFIVLFFIFATAAILYGIYWMNREKPDV
jgi:hypothetical protein